MTSMKRLGGQLLENKVERLIGLCMKSGNITFGMDATINQIRLHKSKLVIVAKDSSMNTKNKIKNMCEFENIPIIEFGTIEKNSKAIGRVNKAIISIDNSNFANAIQNIITSGGENFGEN